MTKHTWAGKGWDRRLIIEGDMPRMWVWLGEEWEEIIAYSVLPGTQDYSLTFADGRKMTLNRYDFELRQYEQPTDVPWVKGDNSRKRLEG